MLAMAASIPRMSDLREQQIAWLENITVSSGLTLTDVARRAGLNPSTLSRFYSNNQSGHALTARTVKKIEDATGVPAYEQRLRPALAFFSEEEGVVYDPASGTGGFLLHALEAVAQKAQGVELWTLKTPALSAVGHNAGDVVIVDRTEQPRSGDAVCALKYDHRRGIAETIFRIYRTPYLLTALANGQPGLPEIVDNENIILKGVIVGSFRLRN